MMWLIVGVWLGAVAGLLHLHYRVRPSRPLPQPVLRPIVIPARWGQYTFTDAEVVDRFLAVDWLLSHRDVAPTRRDW